MWWRFWGISLTCLFLLIILGIVYLADQQKNPPPPRPSVGVLKKFQSYGTHYHYSISGEGMTVVLYPSLGRTGSDFNELVVALNKAGHKTIVLEPRGFKNQPGTENEEITLLDYGDDIKKVLDHEGFKKEKGFSCRHGFGNRVVRPLGQIPRKGFKNGPSVSWCSKR